MRALVGFFVRRHLLVNMIVMATLAVGLLALSQTQRESFPATTLNLISVTSLLPGASAEDVESKLTSPIETAVRRLDGVANYTSTSNENVSVVMVELLTSLSAEEVKDRAADLSTYLDAVDLPDEIPARPLVHTLDPAFIPAIEIFVGGPPDAVRTATEAIADRIDKLPSTTEVFKVGYGEPEIHILIDPERLDAAKLSLDDVMAAIRSRNRSETAGRLQSYPAQKQVVLTGSLHSVEDVANTVILALPQSGAIHVRDVAQVVQQPEDLRLLVHGDGEEGLSVVVRKRRSADIIRSVDRIKEVISELHLPPGVHYRFFNDSSLLARDRLKIVGNNGLSGVILVILVLMLFLSRRTAFWVAFGIPFAVLAVIALLPFFGLTINMVSMAGFVLVIGMVVDDAIVIAERVSFFREQGMSGKDAAIAGTTEMAVPVIASSLTTIMAFSPMFALGGLPGRFAWAIPTVVVLALSASLFECFFLLPSHISGGQHRQHTKANWIDFIEDQYRKLLRTVLPHRKKIAAFFIFLFVGTMAYAALFVPVNLFPQDDAEALLIRLRLPVGASLEQTDLVARQVESQLPKLLGDDLTGVSGRIGHRMVSMTKNRGDAPGEALLRVYISKHHRIHSPLEWIEIIKPQIKIPDDVEILYENQPIGPPLGKPVTVHISSDDDDQRRKATSEIRAALSKIDGLDNLEVNEQPGIRQIDLRPDFVRMARLGLDFATVSRALKTAFLGLPITETRTGSETTIIRLRFKPAARQNLNALLDMKVRSRRGLLVPLRDVLAPVEVSSLLRIYHRDGTRTATLTATLRAGSKLTSSSVAKQIKETILPRYQQREGLEVRIGGEAEKSAETLGQMPFVAGMAFLGMLMIVTLLFGSTVQALFVVLAVPLGYVGVVWTFVAHGMPLSFFAVLGAIGLSGVVVNDSIVMVAALSGRHGHSDLLNDVVTAASERLRPVLLTTLTTVVGVMPTAYGIGGRDALLSPMSLALGWGLVFSTTVTLILVPSLYLIRRDIERLMGRNKSSH